MKTNARGELKAVTAIYVESQGYVAVRFLRSDGELNARILTPTQTGKLAKRLRELFKDRTTVSTRDDGIGWTLSILRRWS